MQKPKNLTDILEGLSEAIGFMDGRLVDAPVNDQAGREELVDLRALLVDARSKVRRVSEA